MKKLFFIAAMAGAALVSCTKNEIAPSATEQNEITFATPVVGSMTKAVTGEIGTTYDKNESFVVYGWYCTEDSFNPANASLYMNGLKVSHASGINADTDTGDQGAWKTEHTYYWPKNGKLTFSAFSPYGVEAKTVSCDVTTGLALSEFTVKDSPADQYDLLYSDRAYNKTTSIGQVNPIYDGVDIQFRHALSSIHVKVKTDMTYPVGTITVNKIELQNVYCTADFKENLEYGTETESYTKAAWSAHYNSKVITIGSTAQEVVYDAAKYGTTALLIPQEFDHNTDGIVTLKVDYTIKNGDGTTLSQYASFKLNEYSGKIGGNDIGLVSQWVKGYRYTYNLTIGLTEVYFAPAVEEWKDMEVVLPKI